MQWRSRISLQFDADGIAGPRAARSHQVIPIASNPLTHVDIARAAPWSSRYPGAERVDVIAS